MTREQAIENYGAKQKIAEEAWKAVRANRTDVALDQVLRDKANQADVELKEAYRVRTKYAPSV
jgi:flagellar hook-basal body complex protein FliE